TMFDLGKKWRGAAAGLAGVVAGLNRGGGETMSGLPGQTGTAAQEQFKLLFDGDYSVDKLAESMTALGGLAGDHGTQVEYTKLQVVSTLAIAAADIAYALACAWSTLGASLSWIGPIEAITMATVRRIVVEAMARLRAAVGSALTRVGSVRSLKGASVEFVQEGAESAVQEAAIRQGQVNAGHR